MQNQAATWEWDKIVEKYRDHVYKLEDVKY